MAGESALMGKKKTTDPRKPYKFVRIRDRLAKAGEEHAAELEQTLTEYVNDALRLKLQSFNRWPPPARPRG